MKIEIKYGVGYGQTSEIITVDDNLSDDEIHDKVFEYICANHLDFGWERI